ncbi:hypothetical protein [Granulicella mallensis]|uniref:Uncharacterized protein n=1 Tax=Granulicella mallensis TaxID=940614 RepID=A0A7W8EAB9_9BACT|nr:hypothetical protein [Granulicella mallensis]MBB5064652.1 hypothetical protein [Granulicella mallensis]
MRKPVISVHLWTERFLGVEEAHRFLSMMRSLEGGKWTPDKWGHFEPIRNTFAAEAEDQVIRAWGEERKGRISNSIYFTKKNPALLLGVTNWKGKVPNLNYIWFDVEASEFSGSDGVVRLIRIITEFIVWSGAVYATAWQSNQRHHRSAPGNPTKRLDQLNWLTFLGYPYLSLLGEDRVRNCSFYSCERLSDGLLLTASESPDSPAITESNDLLLGLEACLDSGIFATEEYPEVPCRVPAFDLRQTVVQSSSSS